MTDTPNSGNTGLPKTGLPGSAASRLRGSGPVTTAHPDANLLAAFSEQVLTAPERDEVLTHLAQCADCREIVSLSLPPADGNAAAQPAPEIRGWFGMRPEFMRWTVVGASAAVVVAAVLVVRPDFESSKSEALRPRATVAEDGAQPRSNQSASESVTTTAAEPPAAQQEKDKGVAEKKQATDHYYARQDAPPAAPKDAPALMAKKVAPAPATRPFEISGARTRIEGQGVGAGQGAGVGGATGGISNDQAFAATSAAKPEAKELTLGLAPPAANQAQDATLQAADTDVRKRAAQKQKNDAMREGAIAERSKEERVGAMRLADAAKNGAKAPAPAQAEPTAVLGRAIATEGVRSAVPGRSLQMMKASNTTPRTWRIVDGKLQSSSDAGQSWESVSVPPGITPQAVDAGSPRTSSVWIVSSGVLLNSHDHGATWSLVNRSWTGGVVFIKFSDTKNGVLRTSTKEEWSTEDGGVSWKKR